MEPRAVRSIFLAKKVYIDELEAKHPQTEEKKRSYHVRAKGFPSKTLVHHAKNHYGNTEDAIFKMYEDLAKGESMKVSLNPTEELFRFAFDHLGVKTLQKNTFKRTLQSGVSNGKKTKKQKTEKASITSFNSVQKALDHEEEVCEMEMDAQQ